MKRECCNTLRESETARQPKSEGKAIEQIKDDKNSKDISNERNYNYFVDEDGDGICLNRHRRGQVGRQEENFKRITNYELRVTNCKLEGEGIDD